jgi:hypothetical protein
MTGLEIALNGVISTEVSERQRVNGAERSRLVTVRSFAAAQMTQGRSIPCVCRLKRRVRSTATLPRRFSAADCFLVGNHLQVVAQRLQGLVVVPALVSSSDEEIGQCRVLR